MADFDPPFADVAEKRLPTADEREQGFPCGPADRALFNGLINRIESEIGEVIGFAGLTPTDDRFTMLREAIEALIAAATGGGDTSQFLLVSQARARLPIFPEIMTATGKMGITSPGTGQVRVPGGVTFQHRGIYPVVTDQTDLATNLSKTYHLRWNPTDGFALKDLASGVYNPTAAAETSSIFDSTYDDMLVARVITNSSNVPTITDLVNKNRLMNLTIDGASATRTTDVNGNFVCAMTPIVLDWARTPQFTALVNRTGYASTLPNPPEEAAIHATGVYTDNSGSATASNDRYQLKFVTTVDVQAGNTSYGFGFQMTTTAIA